ncbi:MAG: peptidoglycan DD-metalloendopeptidase family protein [Deltaproteobacteria bacterium]|nr:peptidoglycan DD-metalloendopeptidase family protein [Deltaproteobacteria bacterium]
MMKIQTTPLRDHDTTRPDVDRAAQGMEAMLFRQVLREVHSSSALFGKGSSAETLGEMFDSAVADQLASGRGLGIGALVTAELEGRTRSAPPGGTTTAPAGETTTAQPWARLGLQTYRAAPRPQLDAPLRVTSAYGSRIDPLSGQPRHHHGVDIGAPVGREVLAAGPGRVVRAGEHGDYGKVVVLDHGDGVETRYAHLDTVGVTEGQEILGGTPLGSVGQTGRTTGPHLHFELRRQGIPEDPAGLLQAIKILR